MKFLSQALTGMILASFLACSTPKKNTEENSRSKKDLERVTTRVKALGNPPSNSEIRAKLSRFKKMLAQGKLNRQGWALHDELLEHYADLKQRTHTKILIPAKSRVTLPIETYCLDSGKASPSKKEVYHWKRAKPSGIPYYQELLAKRRNYEISQKNLQSLIWSLGNKTYWEEYPPEEKRILLQIDSNAHLNLPSEAKDKALGILKESVLGNSGLSEVADAYRIVKGKHYEFEDFRRSIERIKSKEPLPPYHDLKLIPGTDLYTQSNSRGYSSQTVTFYNPSDKDTEIDLQNYYLQPVRSDVQRVGINFLPPDRSLFSDLEKALYEDMARLGIGFTPGLNDIADLYELLTGRDFVSDKSLTLTERALSGVGLIVGSGAAYRYVKRVIHSPPKYLDDFSKGISKTSKKTVSLNRRGVDQSNDSIYEAQNTVSHASEMGWTTSDLTRMKDDASNFDRFGPMNKGTLHETPMGEGSLADTFRSSSYFAYNNTNKISLYRVQGKPFESGDKLGRFWTRDKPSGPVQAILDSALDPTWGNTGTHWLRIEVPVGTRLYEGTAASQRGLIGGGNQVFVNGVSNEWVKDQGKY